jgi:hypothetical protein
MLQVLGRRGWLVLAVAGGLAAVTACGPDAASGTGVQGGGQGGAQAGGQGGVDAGAGSGATLTVTFDVEGAATLKGTATDNVLPTVNGQPVDTCADYAKGGKRDNGTAYFILPLGLGGDLAGQRISLNVRVRDYTGPGNYTQEQLTGEGSAFGVLVDEKAYVASSDGAGAIVSTDAKGDGSFYFEKLALANGGDIAGQISWTCQD